MKHVCLVVGLTLGISPLMQAQPPGPDAQEIARLAQAEIDAAVKKDRTALERLYADDYQYIHSNGVLANREQDLASMTAPDAKWTTGTLTNVKVRVYGNTAIDVGDEMLQGSSKGYVPGLRREMDIWVKRGDRWQLVGGHSTLVSTDTSPTAAQSAVKTLKAKALAATSADERAVAQADEAYAKADGGNDDAKQTAMQTKDTYFVSRLGRVATPNDPPATPNKSMTIAYDSVRAYGTLAVVRGSLMWTDVKGFSPGVLRFTRVWVKDGAAWKLAAEQRTPSAAPRPTT
jgi:hypothetical protein